MSCVTATINCDGGDYPISNLCGTEDITYSDIFTDSRLWADIDAGIDAPGTPVDTFGEFEVDIHQRFYTQVNSSEPDVDNYAEILVSRANWRVAVPEGFSGYMKVWVWKSITEYDNDGFFTGATDALYASYEWDSATATDRFFNIAELLSVDTTEGTNQEVSIYIRNYTCIRDLDCNTDFPYPDGCIPAGGL